MRRTLVDRRVWKFFMLLPPDISPVVLGRRRPRDQELSRRPAAATPGNYRYNNKRETVILLAFQLLV